VTSAADRRFDPATLSLRPATPRERRACRMLLPESSRWAWPAEYFVALGNSPRQLLGTLAYTPVLQAGGSSWFLALHVIRTRRRQGIGSRLLDVLIDRARSCRIPALVSHVDTSAGPEAAAFLQSVGFSQARTMTTFEGDLDLDRYESVFRPICDRLEARGKVPPGVSVVSLAAAPLDQVSRLYARNLGGTIDSVESFLRRALGRGGLGASFTLMLGGHVVGLHLLDVHEAVVEIHAKIVAPEYRGSWANALLTRECVRRLRLSGRHRIRFAASDNVHYTLKFAERQSVEIVKVASQFIHAL
jgi:GNAT superfamily N-acetyltransferase